MAEAFLLQQGDTREKLMEEAQHIKNIVPERNIDEIYSSLETFFDDPRRVQKVVLQFLDHVKDEELPRRSRKRSGDEHNQPSTSGIPLKKPFKFPVKSDGDNRIETQTDSDSSLDIGESAHSDSHPAEIDRDIETERIDLFLDQFNLTNSSGSTSDVGSEDKINEIKEYLQEAKGIPFLLDEEGDTMDTFTEPVKKVDGRRKDEVRNEPSTSTAPLLAGNGNHENMPETNIPVDLTLPGPSTANYDNVHLPPAGLDDSDVVLIDVNGVDGEKKKAYYNNLIEIFSDADKDFLRAICDKCTQDDNWLSDTISGLLENGYPKAADSNEQEQEQVANQKVSVRTEEGKKMLIEENYNNLLAIFPNADPSYIRETCEQIADDEDAMKKFVGDTLESGKYPTLAEYEERMKVIKIRDKYLKNFKIEEFLDIFPDPFKYFFEEKKNNKNDSELLSLNYLKSRYRKIRIAILQQCLIKNNYSLAKSCAELDNCKNFMKSKRGEHEIQYCEKDMKNIPFMQEVAFIENREKIEKYLNEKSLKRAEAFKMAKENNELLECGCCYDDEVLAEDTVTCNEGHIFCKTCLQKYAETQIGDGKTVFTCLSNCDAEFSLRMLQGVLKPSVFSKMLQRKQIEEVKSAAIPGLEVCPFCDFATIPPEEDKIFRCLNPDCMKESCRKCKEPNHIPLRCEEVEKPEEVKIRTYIEDRMTQALVRTCWRCEKKFIKIDGCNKMRCTCGALMCYICRQPVKDYSHFNGEGGTEYHKCPLFSKNDDLHVNAVKEAAAKARNEALAKNPNIQLKHDPTHILPEQTQPDVHAQPNIHFMQYNGGFVPPVRVNIRIPGLFHVQVNIIAFENENPIQITKLPNHAAGAEAVRPPPLNFPLLPGGLANNNWLNPFFALAQPQHHFVVAGVVAGPRHDAGQAAQRVDNRPAAQGHAERPAEQRQRARTAVAQGQQDVVAEAARGQPAREAAAARGQPAREAAAARHQHQRAAAVPRRHQAMAAAAEAHVRRMALARRHQAGTGAVAATQRPQDRPATQGPQVMPVVPPQGPMPEAVPQGPQAAVPQVAAPPRPQPVPAAPPQGPQATLVEPLRQAVEVRATIPVAHLQRVRMLRVQRGQLPLAGGQPVVQHQDPPVEHPPLAADDFIAQWLARIPPQLEMPAAPNHQRQQEPLPQ